MGPVAVVVPLQLAWVEVPVARVMVLHGELVRLQLVSALARLVRATVPLQASMGLLPAVARYLQQLALLWGLLELPVQMSE